MFYAVKTFCQWRIFTKDCPDWHAVYNFYDGAKNKSQLEIMMQKLLIINQRKLNLDLRYGIIDIQITDGKKVNAVRCIL